MSKHVLIAMVVESALIALTTTLLAQPEMVFHGASARFRAFAKASGTIFLCLTFCWSFILGCVLSLTRMAFRL